MIKLIQNIDVYAPQHLGKKDVLTINDKIVKIADAGTISADGILADATVVDGSSLILTPGFIDSHVHVLVRSFRCSCSGTYVSVPVCI